MTGSDLHPLRCHFWQILGLLFRAIRTKLHTQFDKMRPPVRGALNTFFCSLQLQAKDGHCGRLTSRAPFSKASCLLKESVNFTLPTSVAKRRMSLFYRLSRHNFSQRRIRTCRKSKTLVFEVVPVADQCRLDEEFDGCSIVVPA